MASCPARPGQARPHLEVAHIFRAVADAFRERYVPAREQLKVFFAILLCRTVRLGGHLDVCKACGHETPAYNSCRNRHCPKCQSLAQARWLEERRQRIIPTKYFHVVFTLPQELRALARRNLKPVYDLLLAAAARTLLDFGRSRLHAEVGVTCVLHTWKRDLCYHPHVHCIVTAGGLDDDGHWAPARSRFLFPVGAMSIVFRGKLLEGLAQLRKRQKLTLAGNCADLAVPDKFTALLSRLYRKSWVVYAKKPFGGPEQVFSYLGRYTHRVGISNQRLVSFDGQDVCFRTKHGKTCTIPAVEFVRRFLLHALPAHFVKIRHVGLLAAANVGSKLETARRCLEAPAPDNASQTLAAPTPPSWQELLLALTGIDVSVCPVCGERAMERHKLPVRHPGFGGLDTS
jgi:hypothetical protein